MSTFKWNDENTQLAVEKYQAALTEHGVEYSNDSKGFLKELAEELGAKSPRSVVSKLSTTRDKDGQKVYKSFEEMGVQRQAAVNDKKRAITKPQVVASIADKLGIEYEDIAGLDRAKLEFPQNLEAGINTVLGIESPSEPEEKKISVNDVFKGNLQHQNNEHEEE